MTNLQIAGEDAGAVAAAFRLGKLSAPDPDGFRQFDIKAPMHEIAPLWRALMRIEAQLLLADAADFPRTEVSTRTAGERRVAALGQIAEKLVEQRASPI